MSTELDEGQIPSGRRQITAVELLRRRSMPQQSDTPNMQPRQNKTKEAKRWPPQKDAEKKQAQADKELADNARPQGSYGAKS